MAYMARPVRIAAQGNHFFERSSGYGGTISRLMIDDLKEQEGVHGVRRLRTGRDKPNSCAAFCFHKFVANLFLEPGHRRGAWWVRVVNEHGRFEIPGGNILGICPRCVRI